MTTSDPQPRPPKDPWINEFGTDFWFVDKNAVKKYHADKQRFLKELDNWEKRNGLIA
jgi:hypothetical protein